MQNKQSPKIPTKHLALESMASQTKPLGTFWNMAGATISANILERDGYGPYGPPECKPVLKERATLANVASRHLTGSKWLQACQHKVGVHMDICYIHRSTQQHKNIVEININEFSVVA